VKKDYKSAKSDYKAHKTESAKAYVIYVILSIIENECELHIRRYCEEYVLIMCLFIGGAHLFRQSGGLAS